MRRLQIGERTFLWRVSHRHRVRGDDGVERCAEVFRAYEDGYRRGPLELAFAEGDGRGAGYPQSGEVWQRGGGGARSLDLHRPRMARAIIELALQRGWAPADRALLVDGWEWFDALERDVSTE
jgi:hypothetical protein